MSLWRWPRCKSALLRAGVTCCDVDGAGKGSGTDFFSPSVLSLMPSSFRKPLIALPRDSGPAGVNCSRYAGSTGLQGESRSIAWGCFWGWGKLQIRWDSTSNDNFSRDHFHTHPCIMIKSLCPSRSEQAGLFDGNLWPVSSVLLAEGMALRWGCVYGKTFREAY